MAIKEKEPEVLVCECSSTEHSIIFQYDIDEKEVYCSIHLTNYRSFWERLKHGFKYIFGYRCKYGDFDEMILTKKHASKLYELADFLSED